jgi:hypothetical protein
VSTDAEVGRDLAVNRDAYLLGKLAVGADAEVMGKLAVGGPATTNSYVSAPWLVLSTPGPTLTNAWGLVREKDVLTIGTFATQAEVTQGKVHVPVLALTSTEVTVYPATTFMRDVTIGSKERPQNLTVWGIKFFVQDHPSDPTKVIAYAALEGPEAGTYVRGTAQLANGEATIELPESFRLVTGEQGLTVQVTPLEECNGLYVVEKSPQRIVVRELSGGRGNARFDYLVQGIRVGQEGFQPIRDAGR